MTNCYQEPIDKKNPLLVLFLVNQSASMSEPSDERPGASKAQAIADAVNRCIHELVMRSCVGNTIADRFHVGLIGYNDSIRHGFGAGLADTVAVPVGQLGNQPLRIEKQTNSFADGAGGTVERTVSIPVWYEPVAEGRSRMCGALEAAAAAVAEFVTNFPASFPPIVIHITDSLPTDSERADFADVEICARTVQSIVNQNGSGALLFHVQVSSEQQSPNRFPSHEGQVTDELSKLLFRLSSLLPDRMCHAVDIGGFELKLSLGARGLLVQDDPGTIFKVLNLDLGTKVAGNRERESPASVAHAKVPEAPKAPVRVDDNVQFTVYRPKSIRPEKWYPLLAYAHLDALPADAAKDEPEPTKAVHADAARTFGAQLEKFANTTQDSSHSVPREGELTFVPEMQGAEFNPPRQTIRWMENYHRVEFRVRSTAAFEGQTLRGRMSVFLGAILLAEVALRIKVDSSAEEDVEQAPREAATAPRYRKIFASYSHRDVAIVEQFEKYMETLGDRYLRDSKELRAGEKWNDRLLQMIEEADVFQLFWSQNSMRSPFVRQEWEHALKLKNKGESFIRPTFWEEPFPESTADSLPPGELLEIQFTKLGVAPTTHGPAAPSVIGPKPPVQPFPLPLPVQGAPASRSASESQGGTDVGREDRTLLTDTADEFERSLDDADSRAVDDGNDSLDSSDSEFRLTLPSDSGLKLDEEPLAAGEPSDDSSERDHEFDVPAIEDSRADVEDSTEMSAEDDFSLGEPYVENEDEAEESGPEVVKLDDSDEMDASASPRARRSAASLSDDDDSDMEDSIVAAAEADEGERFAGSSHYEDDSEEDDGETAASAAPGRLRRARGVAPRQSMAGRMFSLALLVPMIAGGIAVGWWLGAGGKSALQDRVAQVSAEAESLKVQTQRTANLQALIRQASAATTRDGLEAELTKARGLAANDGEKALVELCEQEWSRRQFELIAPLSTLVSASGSFHFYRDQLSSYVARFPTTARAADFTRVAQSELPAVESFLDWDELLQRIYAADLQRLGPGQARRLVSEAETLLPHCGGFPEVTRVQQRLPALRAIAQRVQEGIPLVHQLVALLDTPAATIPFVAVTKSDARYYMSAAPKRQEANYNFDYFVDADLKTKPFSLPTAELVAARSGKLGHTPVVLAVLKTLARLDDQNWEVAFARTASDIQAEPKMEPVIKLLWLRETLEIGSRGSQPFAESFATPLKVLQGVEIPARFNWLNPESPDVATVRHKCEQALEGLVDLAAAGQQAAARLAESNSLARAVRYQWVGCLLRNESGVWECRWRPLGIQPAQTVAMVVAPVDGGSPKLLPIGTADRQAVTLDQAAQPTFLEGRPIFLEIQESEQPSP